MKGYLVQSRVPTGLSGKCALALKRRSCYRARFARRSFSPYFQLRFVPSSPAPGCSRNLAGRSSARRIAVLCQVGRSDHFFYKPDGGAGDNEPFTKEELELAEVIESLEPYDRSAMLPHVSIEAMDAIQKTASGMLGMLPPSQFQVRSRSTAAGRPVMLCCGLLGYALRNAEYRLHLQSSLSVDLDSFDDDFDTEGDEAEPLDEATRRKLPLAVLEYIHSLETKLESYQEKEVEAAEESSSSSTNRLLQYVRSMHPDSVNKLSESAGRGVVHAFNLTVKKVVENLHLTQAYPSSAKLLGRLRSALGESEKQRPLTGHSFTSTTFNLSRDNLTDALLWSMLVGYFTKGLECRMALERCVQDKNSKRLSEKAWEQWSAFSWEDDRERMKLIEHFLFRMYHTAERRLLGGSSENVVFSIGFMPFQ